MRKRNVLCGVISAAMFAMPSQGQLTTWTNQTGNNLWSEPTNWSNGVPTATGEALISLPDAQINLGGATWPVGNLRLSGVGVSAIGNGTFVLNELAASNSASATIQAAIRPAGGELLIATQPTFLINGDIDAGSSDVRVRSGAIAGDLRTTGTLRFWQGFTRLLNGNETAAAQIDVRRGTLYVEDGSVIDQSTPIGIADGALLFFAPTSTVRLGALELGSGTSVIGASSAVPMTATVSAVSLTRHDLSTLVLSRTANAALSLRFDTPIANTGGATLATQTGVVPWAVARGTAGNGDYAITTYDLGPNANDPSDDIGLRALNPTLEQRADITGATSLDNVRILENSVVNTPTQVQSLAMAASVSGPIPHLNLRLNAPLTVHSGAILGSSIAGNNPLFSQIDGNGTLTVPGDAYVGSVNDLPFGNRLYIMAPMRADRVIARGTTWLEEAYASKIVSHGSISIGDAVADEIIIQSGSAFIWNGGTSSIHMGAAANGLYIQAASYSAPIHFDLPTNDVNVQRSLSTSGQSIVTGNLTGGGSISFSLRHDGDANWTSGSFSSRGVLQINGTWRMSDAEMVLNLAAVAPNPHGELQGRGSFFGDVIGGIIDPGAPIGLLTIDSFEARGTPSELQFQLTGPLAGTQHDQLRVLDLLSLDQNATTLTLETTFLTTPNFGERFTLIDNRSAAPVLGQFIGLPEGGSFAVGGLYYILSYMGGDGNDVVVTVVPEPTAGMLTILLLAPWRRMRHRSK